MGGYLMELQHFCVNDGEGIRSTVFLAGCPLRCAWCCNPEGQTLENPMTRWVETEEVLQELRRQVLFYRRSGGGVTFSGGEATAQPSFLWELTDALYDEGVSLALESCGYFDFDRMESVLRKMDLIFLDLKLMDPARHRQLTGVDNALILENIRRTAALGLPLVVRIPAVVGANCGDGDFAAAFAFLAEHAPAAGVELLPYHRLGEEKYRRLGRTPPGAEFSVPTQEQLARWEELACGHGLRVVSYR